MKLFKRNQPGLRPDAGIPPSRTPIFVRLAAELPLPSWDDFEEVAA
ncbi:hypothetical protein [Rhodococcus xishaensis]|nr:hypothetical protein [Rhodococcus xishaensis]